MQISVPVRTPKVVFINPGMLPGDRMQLMQRKLVKGREHMRMSPQSAGILKSLTPDVPFLFLDETTTRIDWKKLSSQGYNLVAISAYTHNADRAYQLAYEAKKRGMTPVLGGFHPSLIPNEAVNHGIVVQGEAFKVWPELIKDFIAGTTKPLYKADSFAEPHEIVSPERSVYPGINQQVTATSGCKFRCIFCCMAALYKGQTRLKSVKQVVSEIEEIGGVFHRFYFGDDNLMSNKEYAMELFSAMRDINSERIVEGKKKIEFFAFIGVEIGDRENRDLLELAKEAGLYRAHMGIETLDVASLKKAAKRINLKEINPADRFRETMEALHERSIASYGAIIIGFDEDTRESIVALKDFLIETGVNTPIISFLTPYPGTPLHTKLSREGRIIDRSWTNHDMGHMVISHPNFSHREITDLYWEMFNDLYSAKNIVARLILNSQWRKTTLPSREEIEALISRMEEASNKKLFDDSDLPELVRLALEFVDKLGWEAPKYSSEEEALLALAREIRSNFRAQKRLRHRLHPQLIY